MKKIIILIFFCATALFLAIRIHRVIKSNNLTLEYPYNLCSGYNLNYKVLPPNDVLIKQAKTTILRNSGVSEEYFDNHFSVDCILENNSDRTYNSKTVIYKFTIGDYQAKTSISTLANGEFGSPYQGVVAFKNLKEIQSVIPYDIAMSKIKDCSKSPIKTLHLALGTDNTINSTTLFLQAQNYRDQNITLNLETGECATRVMLRY